ncbi:MAG: hypothetical protein NWE98_04860 [Candidatus Bathyarchaeota archaeon]|nr:hypothetical protein [Candidatus Bathyarchaeota archaeon]
MPQETAMPIYQNPNPPPAPTYYYPYPPMQQPVSHNSAIISFIAGMASAVLFFFFDELSLYFISFICCVVAVAVGYQATKNKDNWGILGIVIGFIMLLIYVLVFLVALGEPI